MSVLGHIGQDLSQGEIVLIAGGFGDLSSIFKVISIVGFFLDLFDIAPDVESPGDTVGEFVKIHRRQFFERLVQLHLFYDSAVPVAGRFL